MAPIDSRYVRPGENCPSASATHAIAEKEETRNKNRAIKVETKTKKETSNKRGQNESMNLTVQKASTKRESLMTYRGKELRSPFAEQCYPDTWNNTSNDEPTRMVAPTAYGTKTSETQPTALAGDWSRRSATAPTQTSTRFGHHQADETDPCSRPKQTKRLRRQGPRKCQSTATLVRPGKYKTTK